MARAELIALLHELGGAEAGEETVAAALCRRVPGAPTERRDYSAELLAANNQPGAARLKPEPCQAAFFEEHQPMRGSCYT
jgi:hypothetical protein